MEKIFIIANWKMHPISSGEAKKLFEETVKTENKKTKIIVCPPFVFLPLLKGKGLGAQNCFWEKEGSFTGEISPIALKEIGCNYVILGHSERRKIIGEDFLSIKKKVKIAIKAGLTPILCVGENEIGDVAATKTLKKQMETALSGIPLAQVIVAYEPVFAIGTGNSCPVDLAMKRRIFIRNILLGLGSRGKEAKIVYGGSVNGRNAEEYIHRARFDGLLVGGASLKTKEFKAIVEAVSK